MATPNEQLAAFMHDAWSRWMRHLIAQCDKTGDGDYSISRYDVERWAQKMGTPYAHLPEVEKSCGRQASIGIMRIFIGDDEPPCEG